MYCGGCEDEAGVGRSRGEIEDTQNHGGVSSYPERYLCDDIKKNALATTLIICSSIIDRLLSRLFTTLTLAAAASSLSNRSSRSKSGIDSTDTHL